MSTLNVKGAKIAPPSAGKGLTSPLEVFKLGQAMGSGNQRSRSEAAASWLARYMGELYAHATAGGSNMKIDVVFENIVGPMQMLREVVNAVPKGSAVFKASHPDKSIVSTPSLRTFFVAGGVLRETPTRGKALRLMIRDVWLCPLLESRRAALSTLSNHLDWIASSGLDAPIKMFMNLAAWDVVAELHGTDREAAAMEAASVQIAAFSQYQIVEDITTRHPVMNDLQLAMAKRQPGVTYQSNYGGCDTFEVLKKRLMHSPGVVVELLRHIARVEIVEAGARPENVSPGDSSYGRLLNWLPSHRSTIEAAQGLGLSLDEALDQVALALRAGTPAAKLDLPELAV